MTNRLSASRLTATLIVTFAVLLTFLAGAVPAREIRFPAQQVKGNVAVFAIKGIRPSQVQVAHVRGRRLALRRVRSGVRRGKLRVAGAGRSHLVVIVDDYAPTVPTGVTAHPADGGVVVSWTPSRDNESVVRYFVRRNGRRVGSTRGTRFVHRGSSRGAYTVRAVDAARNFSRSSRIAHASDGEPVPAPTASAGEQSWTCGWGGFSTDALPTACWRPYSNDSWINTPLPASPKLAANSRAMVERMFRSFKIPSLRANPRPGEDWYHAYYFSRPSDPAFRVVCNKHAHACPIEGHTLRIPARAREARSTDGHMAVIDQDTGWEYDFWNVQSLGAGVVRVGWGGRTKVAGQGGGDARTETPANMSATGLVGGIIRYPEIAAGRIDHALFLVVGCTNGKMVFPGRDYGGTCGDPRNAPASGQWLRLDLSPGEIDRLGVSPWQKTILKALARYGGFVGDAGSDESIGFHIESPETYTSVGLDNPWLGWAAQREDAPRGAVNSFETNDGVKRYALEVTEGLDRDFWTSHLEVVDPCVVARTC